MNYKKLIVIIKSPAAVVLLVSLLLFTLNLYLTYKVRPFNSDDVFWQTILLHWHPFSGTHATLGNSSIYVDKIPFFEFFNHFFTPSRKVLFVEAAINALPGFIGFYMASLYFLKKARIRLSYFTLLPFVWLSSLGYPFIQLYLNTNWRGFQLGISFVLFALVAAIWYKDITFKTWWSKLLLACATAYIGLQVYSDPYFLYFTIGPLIILSAIVFLTRKITKAQFFITLLPLLASLVVAKLAQIIFSAAGIRTTIDYPMEFVHYENIWDGFNGSLHSIVIIFNSEFFGHELKDVTTLSPIFNFVILAIITTIIAAVVRRGYTSTFKKLSLTNIWQYFFVAICGLVFVSHSISTLGHGTYTYRYFLFFALLSGLLLAFVLGTMKSGKKKQYLAGLLIVASLVNILVTVFGNQDLKRSDVANNRSNTINTLIANLTIDRGYTKGYANYWDANISTYLAGGKVSFLPSVCNNHKAQKWYWLINDNAFDKQATKSFYFFNPDVPAACQRRDVDRQFGKPKNVITIGNKALLLYDYDISRKMQNATN